MCTTVACSAVFVITGRIFPMSNMRVWNLLELRLKLWKRPLSVTLDLGALYLPFQTVDVFSQSFI